MLPDVGHRGRCPNTEARCVHHVHRIVVHQNRGWTVSLDVGNGSRVEVGGSTRVVDVEIIEGGGAIGHKVDCRRGGKADYVVILILGRFYHLVKLPRLFRVRWRKKRGNSGVTFKPNFIRLFSADRSHPRNGQSVVAVKIDVEYAQSDPSD